MRSRDSPAADRISNLPCEILEKILGRLPLRDAVKTTVLSKKWSHKWVVRSELVFDEVANVDEGLLKTIIYQVLLVHQGPLQKFSLQVANSELFPDIHHWILLLSKKNVQKFSLSIRTSNDFHLPSQLFEFQDLSQLELFRCKFHPPPNFVGFSRLVSLTLLSVTVDPTSFQTLLASSPLLECLLYVGKTPFDCFTVEASRLKFFVFCGIAKSICFKKTPLLEVIVLSLPFNAREFFAVPESQVTLHNIRILKFRSTIFNRVEWVAYALHLISHSPNLQRLLITSYGSDSVESVIHLLQSQEMPQSALLQLKSVDMKIRRGNTAEMQFLKYLLSSAAALEKVCVICVGLSQTPMEMMEEMKQFPRASPNVEFICNEVDIPSGN